jgi:hypothetical protein
LPSRTREKTSIAVAATARIATSRAVPGVCFCSSADSVSAAKAAMSPNGTKITRVTVKISTMPMASRT